MLGSLDRRNLVAAWAWIIVAAACGAALSGVSITLGNSALFFAVCVAPPMGVLMVWHGALPPTMQRILYAADRRE
jgi:hypothetical protein